MRLTHDVTGDELAAALELLPTIERVIVKIPANPTGPVCGAPAPVVSTVEFLSPTGDAPLLRYALDGVTDIAVSEVFAGTKEEIGIERSLLEGLQSQPGQPAEVP